MARIVTLGELLMRLSTPGHERFPQANTFNINFGGAEANVAAALAGFGHDAEFVTKLPSNGIAQSAVGYLRGLGIKTDNIAFGGKRIGIYFLEAGAASRPSKVIYDRAFSSFSEVEISDLDLDRIMEGAELFHVSGITPSISERGTAIAEAALVAAKNAGATISFDINYRSKLLSTEKAASILPELVRYADICFANSWDASTLLSVNVAPDAPFDIAARAMSDKYGFKYVVASKRNSISASANDYFGMIYSRNEDDVYFSKKYTADPIIDRVGTGDAFCAGVLCGLIDGKDHKEALEFGTAAAVLKHTVTGDICCFGREEVEALARGAALGIGR